MLIFASCNRQTLILLINITFLLCVLAAACLGIPSLCPKVELIVLPFDRSSLPVILLWVVLSGRLLFLGKDRQHLGLAIVDPLIEDKICNLEVLPLVLETTHDHYLYEEGPVRYALDQLVLLPQVCFICLHFLKLMCEILNLDACFLILFTCRD